MKLLPPLVIALVGAESTGKTTLSQFLATQLTSQGWDAVAVPEVLREFCDQHGRTPLVHEQAALAQAQTERIAQASAQHQLVLADTTALMIAVYSDYIFNDQSLYSQALAAHQAVGLTLLTDIDLPWVADGLIRDGAHVRAPVDALVRQALQGAGLGYSIVSGHGEARQRAAWAAVEHALLVAQAKASGKPRIPWRWVCEKCDDGDCEQHWLPGA